MTVKSYNFKFFLAFFGCEIAKEFECLIVLVTLLLCCGFLSPSFAKSEKITNTVVDGNISGSIDAYFNCERSEQAEFLCVPSAFPVTAYQASGISEEIYSTSTDKADFVDAQNGTALHFNAFLGEYLGFTKDPDVRSNSFSVSFWLKEEPWFNSYAPIISFTNPESNAGWVFDLQDNGQSVRFGVGTMNGTLSAPPKVPVNSTKYTHIVGTFDGSLARVYKDGVLFGSTKIVGNYNPDPKFHLRIGLDSFDFENSWAGNIDDLLIYSRALSENEVRDIHDNSASVLTGLVGFWPFNGNLKDASGNGNNALLYIQTASLAFSPSGKMFFSEKRTGDIRVMQNDKVLSEPFVKLSDLYLGDHEGLLGITLDPKFDSNHYVFVYSTHKENQTGNPINRILRFTDENNKGTNMTLIMDNMPADSVGYYSGGALAFGPDDKLYVSVGIGSHPESSQNISTVFGKILRLNRDGSIPEDNPFKGSPVYALGNKNPYGIAFDKNGEGIITDNGYAHFDEFNVLQRGGNYGFPTVQIPSLPSISINSPFIPPLRSYYNVIAPTQAIFYLGDKYPALSGKFVFGSYDDIVLHAILIGGKETTRTVNDLEIRFQNSPPDNVVAVAQSPQGDVYFAGYNIYKLKSVDAGRQQTVFPIQIRISEGIDMKGMKFLPLEKSIMFDLSVVSKNTSRSFINLQIPKSLLAGIYSVTTNQKGKDTLIYDIRPAQDAQSTLVSINMLQQTSMKIKITGSRINSGLVEQ